MPDLPIILGTDAHGTPISCDLATTPHLLIGGMAGSGKTACIEYILAQLPAGVHSVSIHGAAAEKALAALRAAVHEINNRLEAFQATGVRQFSQYDRPMPRIVLALDDLAPLMHAHLTDAQRLLTRIAQLGRIAGVHLILATQQATPDVLTDLLKANFPGRIAFRTANSLESRALLGHPGAERLTRPGDMLFCPAPTEKPLLVHCPLEEPDEEMEGSHHDGTEE